MTRNAYLTITLPPELLEWLDGQVQQHEFYSRSHGVAYCLRICREAGLPGKADSCNFSDKTDFSD